MSPLSPITEIDFCAWLSQAAPGEALEYHRGFLSSTSIRASAAAQRRAARTHSARKPRAMGLRQAACPSGAAPPWRQPSSATSPSRASGRKRLAVVAAARRRRSHDRMPTQGRQSRRRTSASQLAKIDKDSFTLRDRCGFLRSLTAIVNEEALRSKSRALAAGLCSWAPGTTPPTDRDLLGKNHPSIATK